MWKIDWFQHPVGHGGFHTGNLTTDDDLQFTWMFDCGSRRHVKFNQFLQGWIRRNTTPIDWLFISHFDMDHSSGLETLMSRTVVNDVMLPYVNDEELAVAIIYEIGRGRAEGWFFELIADPARFFLSRGANRVIFLGERGDDIREDTIEPTRPDRRDGTKMFPRPVQLKPPPVTQAESGRIPEVQSIDAASCEIVVPSGSVILKLRPYRAPISSFKHNKLLSELKAILPQAGRTGSRPGLGGLAYKLAHFARTPTGRSKLKKVFDQHAGSSNRSSLSLLSTPTTSKSERFYWSIIGPDTDSYGYDNAAWMNTGDAELLSSLDLGDWETCYRNDLPKVKVLALPHHGSDKNSDGSLQKLCPDAVLTVQVKRNAKKHPGAQVTSVAADRLVEVTEEKHSAVHMRLQNLY